MQKLKKPVSILLVFMMIVSLFAMVPVTASAAVGEVVPENEFLTFTAVEANSSVTMNVLSGSNLQYNNNSGWQSYTAGTQITLASAGDSVRFRGKDTTFDYYNHVSIGGKVACSGNVMSLRLDDNGRDQGLSDGCFTSMFRDCTGLTAAPELPETMLAKSCYDIMFIGCTSLTTAPALPATTLAKGCYDDMFNSCTSLTTAPELPATMLEPYCYYGMFAGCTSLTTAPELPATMLAEDCYSGMFAGCTSLTTAPELPATMLAKGCYYGMFAGCSSIKLSETQTAEYSIPYSVPSGGNGTTASSALDYMFDGTGGTFTGTPVINTIYYVPAPAPETFKVYVKKPTNETYTTIENLTGETTVAQLKEIIADQIDIPVTAQQMLIFAGKKIEDAKTLAEYNIVNESTIFLVIRSYTVTWLNYDNSELGTTNVQYGATPEYNGTEPTKESDGVATFEFTGWTPAVSPVTGDVTYTATYNAVLPDHEHDGIVYKGWASKNSLPTEAGNYYLGYDVTLPSTWTVSTNIRLCLNGNGITKNGGNVITIVSGNLTIDDCGTKTHYFDVNNGKAVNVNTTPGENRESFTGGYITGGTGQGYDGYFWSEGGGIYLDGGNLILNGGTILGNYAAFGGGVEIYSGTMTMNGGTVCYNTGNAGISFRTGSNDYNRGRGASTGYFVMNGGLVANNISGVTTAGYSYGSDYATYNGGKIADNVNTGIYSQNITIAGDIEITGNKYGAGFSNTFSVSGNPVITGNTTSNLSINNGKTINTGTLGENAKIGVTMSSPGVFTNGYDANNTIEPTEIFTADDPTTFVAKNADGEVKLGIYVWTASFNAGGGSGTMDPIEVQKERSFNLPECTFIAPEGKLFLNWSDGTNTYNPGDSCTMTADTEFTAQWIDGIKVSFKANGGSGVMEDVLSYPDYKLPACGFTAPGGKFFNGWLSSADNQVYQPGDTVTLTAETQFKAQWAAEVNYQFDFDNGLPDGWQTSNSNWFLNANGGDYNVFPAHSGQKNMTYYRGGYNTYGELLTSSFDMTNAESATLGFWYTNRNWGGDTDQLVVSYRVGEGDWVQLFATSGNHESWIKEEITLPSEAFAENVRFRFSVIGNYGYGIALDDVELNITGSSKDLFTGHTVTLGGDIGVNFYLDDEVLDTYAGTKTVKFTVDGKETTVAVPATATADGYKVTCNVVAAQMAHKITATLCVDDEAVATDEYSVQEYAEKVYANPGEYLPEDKADKADEFKALAAAMLHYGGEAQTVFADALIVKPDRADSNLDSAADYSAVTADAVAAKINGETSNLDAVAEYLGAKFYTSSLLYLSQNTLRLYFTQNDDSFDPALFDDVRSEYYYYVQKEDIPAAELDDQQSFTVGNGTFTYSALDYVKAVIGSSMTDAQKNLAKALFLYNQAANAYFDDPVPPQNVVDLSTLEGDKELQNGDVVTGTLSGNKKITIAPGATVTLKNATITSLANADNVDYAGITPLGNATILLEGENTVTGGHENYPGIFAAENATLTIDGEGSLDASSNGYGCGIGGGFYIGCGNIIINGGTVTATGGECAAGIGSGDAETCGNITINGGTVTAIGGEDGPGIGGGYNATCGNITINGGTVTAIGGEDAPGIGGGAEATCGNITITDTVTMVTATKGSNAPNSIGAVKFGTCGDVTIAPGANVTQN